jgi:hypothetical protein
MVAETALAGMENVPTVSISQKLQGSEWLAVPLNWGKVSITGAPVVVKSIVVTPKRITN